MDSLQQSADSTKAVATGQARATAISVRLWSYGGAQRKLRDFMWKPDGPLAALVDALVRENSGKIAETSKSLLTVCFENPFHALNAARTLQQKLFAMDDDPASEHVVAAVAVHEQISEGAAETSAQDPLNGGVIPRRPLKETDLPQILVTEGIYQIAKGSSDFKFVDQPKRRAGGSRGPERMYQFLWGDDTVYARVRRAIDDANLPKFSRYVIESELGRGMMGAVYKAHDQMIDRTVALKTISLESNTGNQEENVERLRREAKAAGSLDHPNIITIYDVGQEEGFFYLSMQFVEGQTLADLLDNGRIPPLRTVLTYADQICSAVGFAHQRGVVHRDLKPSNMMLTTQDTIKVLDFGIAKLDSAGLTQVGMVVGTPCYMAPEQALGKKVDHRSDVFSLGAVFYELLTGKKAFSGQDVTSVLYKVVHEEPIPPAAIESTIPLGIDAIVRRALSKNPQQRFQNCEELRAAFREQARALPAPVSSRESGPRTSTPMGPSPSFNITTTTRSRAIKRKRSRRLGWVSTFVILGLLAMAAGFWAGRGKLKTRFFGPQPAQVNTPPVGSTGSTTGSNPSGTGNSGAVGPDGNPAHPLTTNGSANPDQPNTTTPGNPNTGGTTAGSSGLPATGSTPDGTKPSSTPAGTANPAGTTGTGTATPTPAGSDGSNTGVQPDTPDNPKTPPDDETSTTKSGKSKGTITKATPPGDVTVQGFHRNDIPSLLRKADSAAARGDYAVAKFEYNIILRLDKQNAAARAGLKSVTEAEKSGRR